IPAVQPSFYDDILTLYVLMMFSIFALYSITKVQIQRKKKKEDDVFIPKINFDVSTKLIKKCKCGFILTPSMKRCPQCGRRVVFYK
ncbi:MAG: hypothetical protein ACTSVI_14365, partial [Promethearchaeota archaeon]